MDPTNKDTEADVTKETPRPRLLTSTLIGLEELQGEKVGPRRYLHAQEDVPLGARHTCPGMWALMLRMEDCSWKRGLGAVEQERTPTDLSSSPSSPT